MGSTKVGGIEIVWYGHATFGIRGEGLVIYTDPFALPEGEEKADLVLITHGHYDHCDPEKIGWVTKEDTVIVATGECASKLKGDVHTVRPGDSITVKGVEVQTVHAYNHHIPNHPKGTGVGYIITLGGTRIYQAGDTDLIDEMADVECDVAILPVGGTYTMDQDQAVKAVEMIGPKVVIPMHYNYLDSTKADASRFKKDVENTVLGVEVRLME